MSQIEEKKIVENLESKKNIDSEKKIQVNETNNLYEKEKAETVPESLDKLNYTPQFKKSVNYENKEISDSNCEISFNASPNMPLDLTKTSPYQLDFINSRFLSVNKKIIFTDKQSEPNQNLEFSFRNSNINESFKINKEKFIQNPTFKIDLSNNTILKDSNNPIKGETQVFKENSENKQKVYNNESLHYSNQQQKNELYKNRYIKIFVPDNKPNNRVELVNSYKTSLDQIHNLYLSKNIKHFHKDKNRSLPQEATKQKYIENERFYKTYKKSAIHKFKEDNQSLRLDLIRDKKEDNLDSISKQYNLRVMKQFKLDYPCVKEVNNNVLMNLPTPNKFEKYKLKSEKEEKNSQMKHSEFKWSVGKEGKHYPYNVYKCPLSNPKLECSTFNFIDEQEKLKNFKNNNVLMNLPTPNKCQKLSEFKWAVGKEAKYYPYNAYNCPFSNSKLECSSFTFIDDQEKNSLKNTNILDSILDEDSVKNASDEKIDDTEKVKEIEIKEIRAHKKYYKYLFACFILLLLSFFLIFYKY